MAKRKSSQHSEPPLRPTLVVAREEARWRLQAQIDKGNELLNREIGSPVKLEEARQEYYRWTDYNFELLRSLFNTDEYARGYRVGYGGFAGHTSFSQELQSFYKDVKYYTNQIQSIYDRLDIIPESPIVTPSVTIPEDSEVGPSNEVFIVHGHDELAKQTVARFIEKLDLRAIVLHEQTSQGRTIIEKFESFSNVGFAVILLTPDDVGMSQLPRGDCI
jgi:CAP12/Pycsar effector protein, TIR domain